MHIQDRLTQLNTMCVKDIPNILRAIEIAKNALNHAYSHSISMRGFYTCHVIEHNVCLRLYNPTTCRVEHGISEFLFLLSHSFIKHVINNIEFYNSGKTYGELLPQLNCYAIKTSNFILDLVRTATLLNNPEFEFKYTKLNNDELYKLKLEWLKYLENHFKSLT